MVKLMYGSEVRLDHRSEVVAKYLANRISFCTDSLNQIQFGIGSLRKVLSPWNHIAWVKHVNEIFITGLLNGTERKHILSYVICHCLGYVSVAFGIFVIRH